GSHTITAVYDGDSNFTGSTSAPFTQTVDQASTSTTVVSSVNPSVFGQQVTFTATVTDTGGGSGTPSGTGTFNYRTSPVGSGTLDGSGQTTITTSSLSVGSHSITAVYGGHGSFLGSTSDPLSQTVNQASTSTAIASSANPSVFGQSVTFTAKVTVNSPGSGTP